MPFIICAVLYGTGFYKPQQKGDYDFPIMTGGGALKLK
jgi:hypothetical protein